MRSLRYLNMILTVIALLLTLQLWTLWTAPGATIGSTDMVSQAHAIGTSNRAEDRKEMIDLLKLQVRKTDELIGLFRSGQARVRAEGMKEGEKKDEGKK